MGQAGCPLQPKIRGSKIVFRLLYGLIGPVCWCELKTDFAAARQSHLRMAPKDRDGGHTWAQYDGLPPIKGGPNYYTVEFSACQQHRLILSPQYSTIPQGDQRAIDGKLIHWTPTLEDLLYLQKLIPSLDMYLPPRPQCPYQYFHQKDNRMLGLPNVIPLNIASDQGTPFMEEETWLLQPNITVPRGSYPNRIRECPSTGSAEVPAQRQLSNLKCYLLGCNLCTKPMGDRALCAQ